MSKLSVSIKNMYEDISEEEAVFASNNLVEFFKILEAVDSRQAHEKSNELANENIRSTN